MRLAILLSLLVWLIIGVSIYCAVNAFASNEGGGGGGYSQLPACGPSYYGTTLYVQGYFWRCVHGTPDHWVRV